MPIRGFDVSHAQNPIDFTKANPAGYTFVVIKATEGTGYVNPTLSLHRAAARAAGMVTGFYHFAGSSVAKLILDPVAEADHFASTVAPLQKGDFLVLDFEPYGYTNLAGKDMVAWSKTWLDRVTARLGVKPLVYMDLNNLSTRNWAPVVAADHGLWLAEYDGPGQPSVTQWPAAAMKQYTSTGRVPGIAGDVDLDEFYGTADQLRAFGYGATPPAPAPSGSDMTPDQAAQLQALYTNLTQIGHISEVDSTGARVNHTAGFYLAYAEDNSRANRVALTQLTAQVAALTATVAALSGGSSLTPAQAQAAAKAGAEQALRELAAAFPPA